MPDLTTRVVTEDGPPWVELPHDTGNINDDALRKIVDELNLEAEELWNRADDHPEPMAAASLRNGALTIAYASAFTAAETYRKAREAQHEGETQQWREATEQLAQRALQESAKAEELVQRQAEADIGHVVDLPKGLRALTINMPTPPPPTPMRKIVKRDAKGDISELIDKPVT